MIWGAVAGLALASAIGGAYWAGHSAGADSEGRKRLRDEQLVADAGAKAASVAAAAIARIRVTNTTTLAEVRREIETLPVYRECSHSAEQLQRINAALTGAEPAQPPGGGQLPAPGAAAGPELRGDHAAPGGVGQHLP